MNDPSPKTDDAKRNRWTKLAILVAIVAIAGVLFWMFGDRLSLDRLADREADLRDFQANHPILVYAIAFLLYVAVTGLSLPGAAGLTLIYGWYFGLVPAVILVSFASTLGATIAFLLSRYLFRDAIQNRFANQLKSFNAALEREGAFYLFTLRLIPAVPFFVINVVMGLTRIPVSTYWWVSQVGMLAGTIVYTYAGSTIPSLASLADPSKLQVSNVRDWDGLMSSLRAAADDPSASAPRRIWDRIGDDSRQTIENAISPLDGAARKQIVVGLNRALSAPDLALTTEWTERLAPSGGAYRHDPAAVKQRRAAEKRITRINRDVLEGAFPEAIAPPQPILSWQLVLAFVALGLFPLVAKKTIERLRRARA